jgi:hypothetical protein
MNYLLGAEVPDEIFCHSYDSPVVITILVVDADAQWYFAYGISGFIYRRQKPLKGLRAIEGDNNDGGAKRIYYHYTSLPR